MIKALQYFDDAYLRECQKMSATQILRFLEDYKKLQYQPGKLVQINLRVPKNILAAFKARAEQNGLSYQRKIKELMAEWALNHS